MCHSASSPEKPGSDCQSQCDAAAAYIVPLTDAVSAVEPTTPKHESPGRLRRRSLLQRVVYLNHGHTGGQVSYKLVHSGVGSRTSMGFIDHQQTTACLPHCRLRRSAKHIVRAGQALSLNACRRWRQEGCVRLGRHSKPLQHYNEAAVL